MLLLLVGFYIMDKFLFKRGSTSCAAKDCRNTSKNCTYGFFSFPSDAARAETWAIAAGREDLIEFREILNKSHRLCGAHFEKKMFIHNNVRRLLLAKSVPTLFPCMKRSSCGALKEHEYCHFLDGKHFNSEIRISSDVETEPEIFQDLEAQIQQNILISPGTPLKSKQRRASEDNNINKAIDVFPNVEDAIGSYVSSRLKEFQNKERKKKKIHKILKILKENSDSDDE